MQNKYLYKFQIKPGRYVYIPTENTIIRARDIITDVHRLWTPHKYFYHIFKRGGHLGAMRVHLNSKYKAALDLENFFTHSSRTKVRRALGKIGVTDKVAKEIVYDSCVSDFGSKFLPYGFPQSMCLATLSLEHSAFGSELWRLKKKGVTISVYVDDIVISADDKFLLSDAIEILKSASITSGYPIAATKIQYPSKRIEVFNCILDDKLSITDDRMERFADQMLIASPIGKKAIIDYVEVVNKGQAKKLELLY
jgi:hypothetical protein